MRKQYIIGAVLGLLTLVSCNQKMEFNNVPFAAFNQKSFSVKEDAGTAKVDLTTYGITAETPVTLSFGGTAKVDEDYTVSGAEGGIITFSEAGTKSLTFNIVNHPNQYRGNLTITLKIDSVPDGVEMGALKSLTITILENDIPVDWKFVEGEWTAQDYDDGAKDGNPYKVTISKSAEGKLILNNLWGGEKNLEGEITFDTASNSATVSFAAKQVVFDATDYGYGELLLLGLNAAGKWSYSPVIATITAGGISLGPWNMVITAGQYANYVYGTSYTTEMTK